MSLEGTSIAAALTAMLVAGLAGSLHCIGMCGPILVGFSQVFAATELTVGGRSTARPRLNFDFLWYHAGRLWTYAALGFLAGIFGQYLRGGSAMLGWQRPMSIAMSTVVILTGLVMLRVVPFFHLPDSCNSVAWRGSSWFATLLRTRGLVARLLLGAVMGLLPCGLLYGMLVVSAALPHPLLSAASMLAFGIGTLPALTGVLLAAAALPVWLRLHGTRLAAVVVILTGSFMLTRTLLADPDTGSCPACAAEGR